MTSDIVKVSFDYSKLPTIDAEHLRGAAGRIRKHVATHVESMIAAGRDLLQVKAQLPHGQFRPWLAAECLMSERCAQRFMLAAQWAVGKPDTVSLLETAAVHLLARPSTPAIVTTMVLKKLDEGEQVPLGQIRLMVNEEERKTKVLKFPEKKTSSRMRSPGRKHTRIGRRRPAHRKRKPPRSSSPSWCALASAQISPNLSVLSKPRVGSPRRSWLTSSGTRAPPLSNLTLDLSATRLPTRSGLQGGVSNPSCGGTWVG